MATHVEMLRLARDPPAVRSLAGRLLNTPGTRWSDKTYKFLEDMAGFEGPGTLNMRAREALFGLRDSVTRFSNVDGFSVDSLINNCWLARQDLADDEDEEWIDELHTMGATLLYRWQLMRLFRCCREVGVIEPHQYIRVPGD